MIDRPPADRSRNHEAYCRKPLPSPLPCRGEGAKGGGGKKQGVRKGGGTAGRRRGDGGRRGRGEGEKGAAAHSWGRRFKRAWLGGGGERRRDVGECRGMIKMGNEGGDGESGEGRRKME